MEFCFFFLNQAQVFPQVVHEDTGRDGNNYSSNSIYRCRWATGVDTADLSLIYRGIAVGLPCVTV